MGYSEMAPPTEEISQRRRVRSGGSVILRHAACQVRWRRAPDMAIAPLFQRVIKRWAMKPESALILLAAFALVPSAMALRLEPVRNDTNYPLPVVDIESEDHVTVAQLFVMPGETMKLDSKENPAAGAGYYQALPGDDYYVIITPQFQLPRLRKYPCPCVLHVDKIGWNRAGDLTTIVGLRPYLETASGAKIAMAVDAKHPTRLAKGKLYFRLQGYGSGEYWVLTKFGQIVQVGGPWGILETTLFFLEYILPWTLAILLAYSIVGAIRLWREEALSEKSLTQLMLMSFKRSPFSWGREPEMEEEE